MHVPNQQWDCRSCERPWPCSTARIDLGAEFVTNPAQVGAYLNAQRAAAARDLDTDPADLFVRFLGWI